MLARRSALLEEYPQYFKERDGIALLWIKAWGGTGSLSLDELDPYFIEICRRVRLVPKGEALIAKRAGSKRSRIDGKSAKGNVGDHWTPVERTEVKALSVSSAGIQIRPTIQAAVRGRTISSAASHGCARLAAGRMAVGGTQHGGRSGKDRRVLRTKRHPCFSGDRAFTIRGRSKEGSCRFGQGSDGRDQGSGKGAAIGSRRCRERRQGWQRS